MHYNLIRSSRRKTISAFIDDSLQLCVRAPYFTPRFEIESFLESNCEWIEKAKIQKKRQLRRFEKYSQSDLEELKRLAAQKIIPRVDFYSKIMNVKPTGVKITSAKKRFGSCSAKNSICFSCYLADYPDKAVDYVVVHELAHIKHHNHGREFYAFVESVLPDYRQREAMLKN